MLLDGGPGRVFGDADNEALEEDLCALKDLFVAGGDGVPAEVVSAETKRADQLLMLMALDTTTVGGEASHSHTHTHAIHAPRAILHVKLPPLCLVCLYVILHTGAPTRF